MSVSERGEQQGVGLRCEVGVQVCGDTQERSNRQLRSRRHISEVQREKVRGGELEVSGIIGVAKVMESARPQRHILPQTQDS